MNTSDAYRAKVAIPSLIPRRDEGLSPIGIGLRMMSMHFNTYEPSSNRGSMWYPNARPINKQDEVTAFYCQRSGYRFAGRFRMVMKDGTVVGSPFYREED